MEASPPDSVLSGMWCGAPSSTLWRNQVFGVKRNEAIAHFFHVNVECYYFSLT